MSNIRTTSGEPRYLLLLVRIVAITCGSFLLTTMGCANPLNRVTYGRYHNQAVDALRSGDLTAAEEAFRRALINAQVGHLGAEAEHQEMYNLSMVKRDLCKLRESEDLLRASLNIAEKSSAPDLAISKRLFELGHLAYEQERYAEAVSFLSRGITLVDRMGPDKVADVEGFKPYILGLTDLLDEYADALRRVNQTAEADAITGRAKALRAKSVADVSRTKYPPRHHPSCRQ